MKIRDLVLTISMTMVVCSTGQPAHAGPLLDWLFGYRTAARPAYPVGPAVPVGTAPMTAGYAPSYGVPGYAAPNYAVPTYPANRLPTTGYAANYGNYYGSMMPVIGPSGYGYPATNPTGIAAATAPSIMSYVPDYRTSTYRAPVTYYRPLMTTDPNTGGQVVALAPCTSYEYQAQRIPTFGYNGLFGSFATPPVQPAAPALPTYTLPSGGVPLAMSSVNPGTYSAYGSYPSALPLNSQPLGTQSYYGNYSALQPGMPLPTYPTQPLAAPGMGSTGGGCLGSYQVPSYTPGLSAAPAPSSQVLPPSNLQNYGVPTNPPGFSLPSQDPNANVPPSLPNTPLGTSGAGLSRPQLRSFSVEPFASRGAADSNAASTSQIQMEPLNSSRAPAPIPEPADYEQAPRWNPGLLKEQDRTALRPIAPNAMQLAGQSKSIRWASFESDRSDSASTPRLRPIQQAAPEKSLAERPTLQLSTDTAMSQPASTNVQPQTPATPRASGSRRTDGWKATR